MKTFLPIRLATFKDSVYASLNALDNARLGKQRVETYQLYRILRGIDGQSKWRFHPASIQWRGYHEALGLYLVASLEVWGSRLSKAGIPMSNERMSENVKRFRIGIDPKTNEAYDWDTVSLPWWWSCDAIFNSDAASLYRKDKKHYADYKQYDEQYAEYVWPHQAYEQMAEGEEKQRVAALYPIIDEQERRWSQAVRNMMRMTATELRALLQLHNIDSTGNLATLQDKAIGYLTDAVAANIVLEPVTPSDDQHLESPLYYGKVHKTRMLATTTTVTMTSAVTVESNKENEAVYSNLPTASDLSDGLKTPAKPLKKKPFKPRYSGHVDRSALSTPSRALSTTTSVSAFSSVSSVAGSVKTLRRTSSSLSNELITPVKRARRALITSAVSSVETNITSSSLRARSTNRNAAQRIATRRQMLQ